MVQGPIGSSAERGAASETSKGLDLLGMAMFAVSEKPYGCEHR